MNISIDKEAGFCFGVDRSIEFAEKAILNGEKVKCLGQLVHNESEIERLEDLGIEFIDYEEFSKLNNETVLLRAHGEPPSTYEIAKQNNITLIDATCPIVSSLQHKVYCSWEELSKYKGQIVIFGTANHPEVEGLNGQTKQNAIIVNDISDLDKIDTSKPIHLFTQTTKNKNSFEKIREELLKRVKLEGSQSVADFKVNNSICKHVSNREDAIIKMAINNDVVLFVAGKNSSNGKMLYEICKKQNDKSYYISDIGDIKYEQISNMHNIGITGATSTPSWLMGKVAAHLKKIKSSNK